MRLIKGILAALGLIAILLLLAGTAARFGDGPTGLFPGGPLEAGELVTGPEPDWTLAKDLDTMEFQLVDPPQSRTIWLEVHDKKLYVVSGFMNSPVGRLWKHWPAEAEADGRAVIRIAGQRYERELVRIIDDKTLLDAIGAEVLRKYGQPLNADSAASGDAWFFAVGPRLSKSD
ncbi:MAG: hypothetical protein VCB25_11945 [Myxococcota bacterium]